MLLSQPVEHAKPQLVSWRQHVSSLSRLPQPVEAGDTDAEHA
jgi:hypothetical protein